MKTVIQGKELTVSIRSDRELTTQEIIAAHQLSTGNFEALFISEESNDTDKTPTNSQTNDTSDTLGWVQVEITCPVCTHECRTTTKFGNTFTKCPGCKTPLYNQYATGVRGERDKAGNYYYAQEILRPKNGSLTHEEQSLLKEMEGD